MAKQVRFSISEVLIHPEIIEFDLHGMKVTALFNTNYI